MSERQVQSSTASVGPSQPPAAARSLNDLPVDELLTYGRELGLPLEAATPQGELVRRIGERQQLLSRLDHDALLDIARWARLPVRQSASKEELARQIAGVPKMEFKELSDRGLAALAQLRDVAVNAGEPREAIIKRVRKAESMGSWLRRKSRSVVAKVVSHYVEGESTSEAYQFLPEDKGQARGTLREEMMDRGIMTSLATRLRGAADDYVRAKMDEIEQRIDRKLDQIDQRLAEWRDREVANRLRILRITLAASVLVALLSLAYKYVSNELAPSGQPPAATAPMP